MDILPDAIALRGFSEYAKIEIDIVDTILEAASRGLKGITYSKLPNDIVTRLQKKGYVIEKFGMSVCTIKWDK